MTIRPILQYPDPGLRKPATAVTAFDEPLRALVQDLIDTMRAAPGIGITACHIGVLRRVVVLELSGADGEVYVNPVVTWADTALARHEEGSISMPGLVEIVERPAHIKVGYQDLDGTSRAIEVEGLRSVCLQHEIDQLDGIFWIQRLSRLRRERLIARFEKLQRRT